MQRSLIAFILIMLIAGLFRVWLISTDALAFESDEAMIALMGRHISQGESIPVFFYGQEHMGSLDAVFVAIGFKLFGVSIHTMRYVEGVLYLIAIGTGYGLALEITHSPRVASMSSLLLTLPTMAGVLYTSLALGGYVETVIWGNLLFWLAWQITQQQRDTAWRWIALGFIAGLGWWTYGAIIIPCAVVGLMILRHFRWRLSYVWAAAAFFVGSEPWWYYNFQHDWVAFRFVFEGYGAPPSGVSHVDNLVGFLLLGLPTLYGLRFPWQAEFVTTLGAIVAVVIYWLLLARSFVTLRHRRGSPAEILIWVIFLVFGLIFTFASFPDATGRYLMPLWVPAAIGLALGLDRLRQVKWQVSAVCLGLLLTFQVALVVRLAYTSGIQFQLVKRLEIPVKYDQPLLDFLAEEGYTRGYASYWTSYRLMFRSDEAMIFDTSLPYDYEGYGANDNRYAPYQTMVAEAERVVWITQNFPELDVLIERRLAERSVTYEIRDFGPYRVYYQFSERIAPADVGLNSPRPIAELD
jgi:hypothetical protein